MQTKICTECQEEKELAEFTKQKAGKYGVTSKCKECMKLYREKNKKRLSDNSKLWYINNKEKVINKSNKYYKNNKDKILGQRKEYRKNNREKIKQYRLDNQERINTQTCKYREVNKERVKEVRLKYYIKNREKLSTNKRQHIHSKAVYEKYKDKLTIDESPRLSKDGVSLEVKCRYCGKYFIPSVCSVNNRMCALNSTKEGQHNLYCSYNCKKACPIFGKIKYPKKYRKASSREVDPLVRQLCLERDNWECQKCGATQKEEQLHVHHIKSYSQNKMLGNDVENCITLCKNCHKEIHSKQGCNYYELRCKN